VTGRQLAGLGIAAALLAPQRFVRDGPTLCLFRRATGRPCPSCGLTRAWNAAARLRLRDSLRFHPLGMPALAAAAWLVARPPGAGDRLDMPRAAALAVVSASWLGVWLWRLRPPGMADADARRATSARQLAEAT
jgi:hypothetical protein